MADLPLPNDLVGSSVTEQQFKTNLVKLLNGVEQVETEGMQFTLAQNEQLEVSRIQNKNKFTYEQVLFNTMPTGTTGTTTVVTRNGVRQLKIVSASTGGEIKAYWDFPVSTFTREFAGSLCIEGLTAGKNGYVGIQQLDSNNSIIASDYAQTNMSGAIDKQTFKAYSDGVVQYAVKIRLIAFMQTDAIREMYIHSPFIADGTNAEFIAPEDLRNEKLLFQPFIRVSGKNQFNKVLAKDKMVVNYKTGVLGAYDNGIAFGMCPVQAGGVYTFSMPTSLRFQFKRLVYTYDKNGVYLGMDVSAGVPSESELVNTLDAPKAIYSDGDKTVTLTVPDNTRVASIQMMIVYEPHTSTDFNSLIDGMQLELGNKKTDYVAYDPNAPEFLFLKSSALLNTPTTDIASVLQLANTFTVILDGTDAYIRVQFNATSDLVYQVRYNSADAWKNNVVNPWLIKSIPALTKKEDTITAFSYGAFIATQGDDATPLHYNNTYIGANHGAFIVHQVVKSGHGKTYSDVGSKWTDGTRNYTLIRIVDTNTLWFVSDNTGTDAAWVFYTTALPTGSTFTHVSGATNTASITSITSDTITQLLKALNNHSKKIIANGVKELTENGIYEVDYLEIIDAYDIINIPSLLSYLQSKVGTPTEQKFDVNSIASDVRLNVTYRYGSNGAINTLNLMHFKKAVKLDWLSSLQALPLNYGGKNLLLYVPKVNPVVSGSNTWDLKNVSDVSTTSNVINLSKTSWIEPNDPPDRMVSIVRNGATREFGQILGNSITRGITKPTLLKNSSEVGFFNGPTKKMYPHILTGDTFPNGIVPAGTVLNAVSYRLIFSSSLLPEATCYGWYEDNMVVYVFLDIHQSTSMLKLPLPPKYNGKNAELITPDSNFTLHNEIVSDGGLLCSVMGNYSTVTIKLS
ncbi:hypothetical protein QDR34_11170 [Acinetobacter baumannii]|uniref:hypothetical protein n=1 Tax=Acinetobacter baumannii TaxID=470 RepID=UPI00244AAF72|nr:hypothetical protein [Acinetobacter baumannii]MDH2468628.1 hypothetical protein [Acinetobacter baumannii]MDO7519467.1 hypothetical protein [Acinetobacter baumannii]HCH7478198.1 hypothetical protein [Acinetobacter baumannii]